jgi:hypothetical protein
VPCPNGGVVESEGFGDGDSEGGGDELGGGLDVADPTMKMVIAEPAGSGFPTPGAVA